MTEVSKQLCEKMSKIYLLITQHRNTFLKAAQYVDPKYHAELEGLIKDFELEFVEFEPGTGTRFINPQ